MNEFPWTEDLDAALTRYWPQVNTLREIARLIGCAPDTAVRRAMKLGLPQRDWRSLRYSPILSPMAHLTFPRLRQCQWPHGEVGDPDFQFCGEPVLQGYPYCPAHKRRAYRTWERKEDAA